MKKILVIEDERMLREAYNIILTHAGYQVYEAEDGLQGLKQLNKVKPDLILLDILMPNIDGPAFLKKARLKQKHPAVKVIAFSNLSDEQKLEDMQELGATKQILKSSLSPSELVAAVKELI